MNTVNEEQEAFHSKSYKFSIPNNINDFNNSSNQSTSKSNSISKVFNNLKINSKNDIFKEDAIQQQIKRQDSDVNDMQIEEFASEQSVSQTEQITIIDNKNEGKGKSKRIYSEDEKEDLTDDNKSKKIKLRPIFNIYKEIILQMMMKMIFLIIQTYIRRIKMNLKFQKMVLNRAYFIFLL
ncbi:unnamed protein product [Rhizophagus irregularis]|uniref:Transmembrane protein n=1 Tax=Rhizophagus irregularis TaxID=588596 RepID=A0A916DYM6_9GLOM|nr:unnamed protein product [Rhizophagus irregularis]